MIDPNRINTAALLAGLLTVTACSQLPSNDAAAKVSLSRMPFGTLSSGLPVEAVVLTNRHGMSATLITYGATVQSLRVPDRKGTVADIAVGYDDVAGYETTPGFTNVTVGRYANRIAGASFTLDGKTYPLVANQPPNQLHGGSKGWDKLNWAIKRVDQAADKASVTFTLTSPDGDQGFPGTVTADVTYELNDHNDLVISYSATTDKPTVISMTYHSMLNLGGIPATQLATDAQLKIEADAILAVDQRMIPTGEFMPVAGTPFDFRSAASVTERVRAQHPQLALANQGIDHNHVLRGGKTATPKLAVTLEDPRSGRGMTVATTEAGMQVYTGNFFNGKVAGKGGHKLTKYQSISVEAQAYPDTPNRPSFPGARLDPGQTYSQTTVYHFYQLR